MKGTLPVLLLLFLLVLLSLECGIFVVTGFALTNPFVIGQSNLTSHSAGFVLFCCFFF